MTGAEIVALRSLLAKATQGPWQLQDGSSWRRIGTLEHDGNVLCPSTYSRDDRHPDLTAGKGEDLYANLNLIVAAVSALPALLDRLAAAEAERGAAQARCKQFDWRQRRLEAALRVARGYVLRDETRQGETDLAVLDAALRSPDHGR